MEKNRRREGMRVQTPAPEPILAEVEVRYPQRDCPHYEWDRTRARLSLVGIHHAKHDIPADIAVLHLEGQVEVPTFLLSPISFQPETLVQVQVLGALGTSLRGENDVPITGWFLVAVPKLDTLPVSFQSLAELPHEQLTSLKSYVATQMNEDTQGCRQENTEIVSCDAQTIAHMLRESRLALKQARRRQHPHAKGWLTLQPQEEKPVAWRTIQELSQVVRAEIQQTDLLNPTAPHAQAEQLIRFVPQRFQQALADLLLDDERLLAFLERPLLRHSTGFLGLRTWRSNEGLFLMTDRQVLWLRDFQTPGSGFPSGGYFAHSAPLERLKRIELLQAKDTSSAFAGCLEEKQSPYLRLVMEIESRCGSELFVVAFPAQAEVEQAMTSIAEILQTFLPLPEEQKDQRLRRLPVVDAWQPRGVDAERLVGLGGIVSSDVSQQLEHWLHHELNIRKEELLVSVVVTALEETHTPARIVALTRQAVLVIDERSSKQGNGKQSTVNNVEPMQRYELVTISSVQLRHSLVGSSLSLFVPLSHGRTQQVILPFHSPAVAWFLPLFMRLRVLLNGPYRLR